MLTETKISWPSPGAPRGQKTHRSPNALEAFVFELLKSANGPLGAYDIARRSRQAGTPLAPNQVYRILDRLVTKRKAQRIEILSAYMPSDARRMGYAICRDCHAVETYDITALAGLLAPMCEAHHFSPDSAVIEVSGLCQDCEDRSEEKHRRSGLGGVKLLVALLAATGATIAEFSRGDEMAGQHPLVQADNVGEERRPRISA